MTSLIDWCAFKANRYFLQEAKIENWVSDRTWHSPDFSHLLQKLNEQKLVRVVDYNTYQAQKLDLQEYNNNAVFINDCAPKVNKAHILRGVCSVSGRKRVLSSNEGAFVVIFDSRDLALEGYAVLNDMLNNPSSFPIFGREARAKLIRETHLPVMDLKKSRSAQQVWLLVQLFLFVFFFVKTQWALIGRI